MIQAVAQEQSLASEIHLRSQRNRTR